MKEMEWHILFRTKFLIKGKDVLKYKNFYMFGNVWVLLARLVIDFFNKKMTLSLEILSWVISTFMWTVSGRIKPLICNGYYNEW